MGVFIGLDVSLAKTAVCVVDRDGTVLWQGKVPSEPDPLIARLAEWSGSPIADTQGNSFFHGAEPIGAWPARRIAVGGRL
jgi:hypothetical protein